MKKKLLISGFVLLAIFVIGGWQTVVQQTLSQVIQQILPAGSQQIGVVTASDTTGSPAAYNSSHFTVGTASPNGGAVFFSYDQTNQRGYMGCLTPTVSWRPCVMNIAQTANTAMLGIGKVPAVTLDVNGTIGVGSVAFASLGTPANGAMIYCSDCTIANPCAAAGTGALAKRINGTWICN